MGKIRKRLTDLTPDEQTAWGEAKAGGLGWISFVALLVKYGPGILAAVREAIQKRKPNS